MLGHGSIRIEIYLIRGIIKHTYTCILKLSITLLISGVVANCPEMSGTVQELPALSRPAMEV